MKAIEDVEQLDPNPKYARANSLNKPLAGNRETPKGREEYAKWMRQQYGVPQPGDRQEQEQADMQRAQQQQKQAQLQDEAAQAELADKQASAMQKQTAAQLTQARVLEIQTRAAEVAANDPVDDAIAEARQN